MLLNSCEEASCRLGGRPDRGNPRIHLRLDPRLLHGLEIIARKHGLTIHQVIYAMIEGYLAGVGGVAPRPLMDQAILTRVTVTRLKALLSMLRFELDTLDVATVREKRLEDLDKAFQDLNRIVERSRSLDQRVKIYQALGFLCQIIDKLVFNAQKNEITRAALDMEKRLHLLEAGSFLSR
jgi:hypothetical protein